MERAKSSTYPDSLRTRIREMKARTELTKDEGAMLEFATYFIDHPQGERHELFEINDSNALRPASAGEEASILHFTNGTVTAYAQPSPEDVRRAAAVFQEQYPEIEFTFDEDRMQKLFSYTARLTS